MKRLLIAISMLCSSLAIADEKGIKLAQEADERDRGFGSFTSDMKMILIDEGGNEVTRGLKRSTLEVLGDGDRTLNVFTSPPDVSGTAVLTFSHPKAPDEQWILLPALRRVKRIATNNKSGPFLGSEFSFEDLGGAEVDKYTYTFVKEDSLDGRPCFLLELKPTYEYSGYSKLLQWLDKEMYQPLKIEYYDRKGDLLKVLAFSDYEKFLGKHWRAKTMEMRSNISKRKTILLWDNFKFRTTLKESDFTVSALNRLQE